MIERLGTVTDARLISPASGAVALVEVMPLVYQQCRRIAARQLR